MTTDTVKNIIVVSLFIVSCKNKQEQPFVFGFSELKRGEIVSCGPQDGEVFGTVSFTASVPVNLKVDFNKAIALLHSFEYDEAEKIFAKIIDREPACAMAYWGIAMSSFHSLWAPPTTAQLQLGLKAIEMARSIDRKTKREEDYIEALARFYEDADRYSHRSRVLRFEKAMETLYKDYPDDREAAVFYALALNAAADPTDKTYSRQKKAVSILVPIFNQQPLHPGIAHYIIHNCDYPALAHLALPAARRYAAIAPASAHAQHMPSHIFTRLGLWQECINSNLVSASSAKCYAEKANIKGHWDEELHAMDYLVYAYLQKAEDDSARKQLAYLQTISEVYPLNFKTSYAFAAIPARYMLERKQWKEAAAYQLHPVNYPWEKFSWQKSICHFTKLLGLVHTGQTRAAQKELDLLKSLHHKLSQEKEKQQEAMQVNVQVKTGEAWLEWKQGNAVNAVALMTVAAAMEDGMEKHPVTPGEIIPARELLAEMFMEMEKPALALQAFESTLKTHPNRLNALYGAGRAAVEMGDSALATTYFKKLMEIVPGNTKRAEIEYARRFLARERPPADI